MATFLLKRLLPNKCSARTSSWPTARRACARRAALISPHKTNGRHCVPPTDSSVKKKKEQSWSIFTTSLEPTLSKIPEQRKPPRRRSLTLAPPQKSFVCDFVFCARPIFSKRKTKFFCGVLL